jgi:hypothetical protein
MMVITMSCRGGGAARAVSAMTPAARHFSVAAPFVDGDPE